MPILYKNTDGVIIPEASCIHLQEYYKCVVEADKIVKIETYLDQTLYGYTYHNWASQSHQELLKQYYPTESTDLEFCIIDHLAYTNGFRLESLFTYNNSQGQLLGKTISLFDPTNELVGHTSNVLESGTWNLVYHRKYYFDRSINPQSDLCSFSYEPETGKLVGFSISDPQNFGDSCYSNSPEALQDLLDRTGMPENLLPYYLTGKIQPDFEVSSER
ncbi:MAG: hypothetical protein AAFV80_19195 [Bacteroidota bacterium]